jgi:hypothetical protein
VIPLYVAGRSVRGKVSPSKPGILHAPNVSGSVGSPGYAFIASALLGLPACNKAEFPEKVQTDVAKAKSDAVEENAKADEKVKQVEAEAAKDRADAGAKAADKRVGAVVDSAVTQAEGDTKVALAKCEALDGNAQKACKDEANADMDAVKAKAKAAKSD